VGHQDLHRRSETLALGRAVALWGRVAWYARRLNSVTDLIHRTFRLSFLVNVLVQHSTEQTLPMTTQHQPVVTLESAVPCVRRNMARSIVALLVAGMASLVAVEAFAHGNVAPQPVDTKGLPKLKGPLTQNPYRGKPAYKKAISIGESAFNQNCARCHGLGAVSGGIAPDLRSLPEGSEGDEFFQMRIRNGSVRNGVTYMPAFANIFNEQAIWAIRSYLDSVRVDP